MVVPTISTRACAIGSSSQWQQLSSETQETLLSVPDHPEQLVVYSYFVHAGVYQMDNKSQQTQAPNRRLLNRRQRRHRGKPKQDTNKNAPTRGSFNYYLPNVCLLHAGVYQTPIPEISKIGSYFVHAGVYQMDKKIHVPLEHTRATTHL